MAGNVIQLDTYRKAKAIEPFCSPTIDETMDGYLHDMRRLAPPGVYHDNTSILDVLCQHLDEHGPETLQPEEITPFELSARSYCSMVGPERMINNLDHFFRYCLLREMGTDADMRASVREVVFDFCDWLCRKDIVAVASMERLSSLKDNFAALDAKTTKLAAALWQHVARNKTLKRYVEKVDFGRHDVFKITRNDLWLEVWSLSVLPPDLVIGPIPLPKAIIQELHRGWMIECKLGKTAVGEWEFIEVGAIHPSLPF